MKLEALEKHRLVINFFFPFNAISDALLSALLLHNCNEKVCVPAVSAKRLELNVFIFIWPQYNIIT